MKTLNQYIMEASFTKEFGDHFEARIKDKNNFSASKLEELSDELLKEIGAKDSSMIRWIVDTDHLKGTIHYSDVKNYKNNNKTTWVYDPSFKSKNDNEIEKILGKFHNVFPNKSTIVFSII